MRSANRALFLAFALIGADPVFAEKIRILVQDAALAGLRYYAAAEVAHELRVGDALELVRERDNPHDSNAIAVTWQGRKLGYVPKRDNVALAWALDRGAPLSARVSRLARPPKVRRIEIEVFVE
jgi:HIRAN domain